eukprot:scaffold666_cov332-Prasinococcus_capsulatus_cf.AAC.1
MKAEAEMCQGTCSVSLSFDHRSTHTGASDEEIAVTCSKLAALYERCRYRVRNGCRTKMTGGCLLAEGLGEEESIELLGAEFHTPGHIFTCVERRAGLAERRGHTELSTALARAAGVPPIMVGTVILNKEVCRILAPWRRM